MLSDRGRHAGRKFPATRRSVVVAAGDPDPETRRRAWDELVEGYWLPVHGYLRWHWREGAEDARDLTQEFFAAAFDRGTLDRYDPGRSRFRTWLRLCLDGFMANHRKAAGRLKRGGAQAALSLDAAGVEAELAASSAAFAAGEHGAADPEAVFHREWVRSLFGLAVADLRRHCEATGRSLQFQLFARYDLDGVAGFDAADARGAASGAGARGAASGAGARGAASGDAAARDGRAATGGGGTVAEERAEPRPTDPADTGRIAQEEPRPAGPADTGRIAQAERRRPTYGVLADELGLTSVQVTNYLAAARRSLRRLVLRRLRRLTASDAEFRAEARALFGIEVPAAERPGAAGPADSR
jgi:DNA-directed RNA polymerase specialized sigma24 family protein